MHRAQRVCNRAGMSEITSHRVNIPHLGTAASGRMDKIGLMPPQGYKISLTQGVYLGGAS